jgi:hypothetical protein
VDGAVGELRKEARNENPLRRCLPIGSNVVRYPAHYKAFRHPCGDFVLLLLHIFALPQKHSLLYLKYMETTNDKGAKVSLNSIKSLFCDSYKLYQERFNVLTEIVLLPALIVVLGYTLIFLGAPFSILGLLVIFVGWIALIFSSIALVFSVHNNTDVDASYRATMKFFWPLVWMSILSFVAFLGGFVMLIIPAIWLAVAFALRNYTLVIENRRGLDSLHQSKEYISGYWWAVLGRTILLVIMIAIISIILNVPFSLFGKLGSNIVSAALTLFILPFSTIFFYKIYENLRTLKPELHGAQHNGGGFVKVATIVGWIVAALLVIAAIFGIAYAVHNPRAWDMNMDVNNNMQYPLSNQ